MLYRKDLAGKQQQAQARQVQLIEVAEFIEEAQDRWSRVPNRNLPICHCGSEAHRLLSEFFADQDDRGTVLYADKKIEDGQIEMKWCM